MFARYGVTLNLGGEPVIPEVACPSESRVWSFFLKECGLSAQAPGGPNKGSFSAQRFTDAVGCRLCSQASLL